MTTSWHRDGEHGVIRRTGRPIIEWTVPERMGLWHRICLAWRILRRG